MISTLLPRGSSSSGPRIISTAAKPASRNNMLLINYQNYSGVPGVARRDPETDTKGNYVGGWHAPLRKKRNKLAVPYVFGDIPLGPDHDPLPKQRPLVDDLAIVGGKYRFHANTVMNPPFRKLPQTHILVVLS